MERKDNQTRKIQIYKPLNKSYDGLLNIEEKTKPHDFELKISYISESLEKRR